MSPAVWAFPIHSFCGQGETVESWLFSKPLEFDGCKIRIVTVAQIFNWLNMLHNDLNVFQLLTGGLRFGKNILT